MIVYLDTALGKFRDQFANTTQLSSADLKEMSKIGTFFRNKLKLR
jgi:hypothetical protein